VAREQRRRPRGARSRTSAPGGRKRHRDLRAIRLRLPELPIIILTGHGTIDDAVQAVKAGAVTSSPRIRTSGQARDLRREGRADPPARARSRRLEEENRELRATRAAAKACGPRWQDRRRFAADARGDDQRIEKVAPLPRPCSSWVRVVTGKELVARAIHTLSPRGVEPYITINCSGGRREPARERAVRARGGARSRRRPSRRKASSSSPMRDLFLDEIGNMSLEFQARSCASSSTSDSMRVAGSESISHVADRRDPTRTSSRAMRTASFRADLYDRLAVRSDPATVARGADRGCPGARGALLARSARTSPGFTVKEISAGALDRFAQYDYPGNVRELKNIVERAAYMATGERADRGRCRCCAAARAHGAAASSGMTFADDPRAPSTSAVDAFEGVAVPRRPSSGPVQAEEAAASWA